MHFLTRDETKLLEKKLRRQLAEQGTPRLVLYYTSGRRDYARAANAITASAGAFTEATLHFLFCGSGDGWEEHLATDDDAADIDCGEPPAVNIVGCMTRLDMRRSSATTKAAISTLRPNSRIALKVSSRRASESAWQIP